MPPVDPPIPITVLGGYLGAGKTTLLNQLLRHPGGRRLGVIVNDFGSLAIDIELLERSDGDTRREGLVSLPNGCVCCSLGADLYEALGALTDTDDPPDQIVIEASGVADPAVAAAWGTSDGFEPGGVIVLAAADSIRQQARDKYVGGDVRRQLRGADLVVVTKGDLVDDVDRLAVRDWLDREAPDVPQIEAVDGDVPSDVVLGLRPGMLDSPLPDDHVDTYVSWSWSGGCVDSVALDTLLAELPAGVLRMKGVIDSSDRGPLALHVVGQTRRIASLTHGSGDVAGSRLVAIGIRGVFDVGALDRSVATW